MNFIRGVVRPMLSKMTAVIRLLRTGWLLGPNVRLSFAQEGEDLLLARMFDGQEQGFYVDVGAHHPTRFSNTYLLYRGGWRGINIDATPGSMAAFKRLRPRDINLEVAVSEMAGIRRLYRFDEPALNSLDEDLSLQRHSTTDYSLVDYVELPTRPLRDILLEYMPRGQAVIDLMTIDTEGCDFEVIRSNDWNQFRPRVLVIEILATSADELGDREEIKYLRRRGFSVHAKLQNSVVLADSVADTTPASDS